MCLHLDVTRRLLYGRAHRVPEGVALQRSQHCFVVVDRPEFAVQPRTNRSQRSRGLLRRRQRDRLPVHGPRHAKCAASLRKLRRRAAWSPSRGSDAASPTVSLPDSRPSRPYPPSGGVCRRAARCSQERPPSCQTGTALPGYRPPTPRTLCAAVAKFPRTRVTGSSVRSAPQPSNMQRPWASSRT